MGIDAEAEGSRQNEAPRRNVEPPRYSDSAVANALTFFVFDGTDFPAVDYQGKPAFLVGAICAVLGIGNPTMALRRLDDDQKGLINIETLGGTQQVNVVTESGFY